VYNRSRYLNPDTQCQPLRSKKKKEKNLSLSANAKADMNLIAPHYVFLASRFDLYYAIHQSIEQALTISSTKILQDVSTRLGSNLIIRIEIINTPLSRGTVICISYCIKTCPGESTPQKAWGDVRDSNPGLKSRFEYPADQSNQPTGHESCES
jgi:hypothetical protein